MNYTGANVNLKRPLMYDKDYSHTYTKFLVQNYSLKQPQLKYKPQINKKLNYGTGSYDMPGLTEVGF